MTLAGMTQAQFVIGAQGGYYWQKNSTSISDDYTSSSNFVGALQLGYWVTPKLYVGISGGYITASFDTMVSTEHSYYYAPFGMDIRIYDHQRSSSRSGWMVSPQVKYEVARFGNMHFNLLLQGQLRMLGAAVIPEDLKQPPGNHFEALEGRNGYYSIRVNDQWRLTFSWNEGAENVAVEDYH